jgi:hypothetical protein
VEAGRVEIDACHPNATERAEEKLEIGGLFFGVAEGRRDRRGLRLCLARETAQRPAGTDFDERTVRVAQDDFDALAEPDGLAEVTHPVVRIGRLRVRNPGTGEVRHVGCLRRREANRAAKRAEFGEDRLEHRRVRGDVDVDARAVDVCGFERRLHLGDERDGPRNDRERRGIDGGDREAARHPRARVRLGE